MVQVVSNNVQMIKVKSRKPFTCHAAPLRMCKLDTDLGPSFPSFFIQHLTKLFRLGDGYVVDHAKITLLNGSSSGKSFYTVLGWHCQTTTSSDYLGCCSVTSQRVLSAPWSSRVSVTAGSKMLRVTSSILSCFSLLGLGRANFAAMAVQGSGESSMSCSLVGFSSSCIMSRSALVRLSSCGGPLMFPYHRFSNWWRHDVEGCV